MNYNKAIGVASVSLALMMVLTKYNNCSPAPISESSFSEPSVYISVADNLYESVDSNCNLELEQDPSGGLICYYTCYEEDQPVQRSEVDPDECPRLTAANRFLNHESRAE